jgi:predicted DNA-binding transcriptional regulator YafY
MPSNRTRNTVARQWELLKLLPTYGTGKTASQLADALSELHFSVSKRQVERDLNELMENFPIDCDSRSIPYGWRWVKGADLNLPGLTLAEAVSLRVIEDTVRPLLPAAMLDVLDTRFRLANTKLASLAKQNPAARWVDKVRAVPPALQMRPAVISSEVLKELQEALMHGQQVEAEYRTLGADKTKTIQLNPLGLVSRGPSLYLIASSEAHDEPHMYAVHRFNQVCRTQTTAKRPKSFDLDVYIAEGGLQFGNGKMLKLKALVSPWLAQILEETPLAEDQKITPVEGEEDLRLTATVADSWQLRWWILSLGDAIEVTGPAGLRKDTVNGLQDALSQYQDQEETE